MEVNKNEEIVDANEVKTETVQQPEQKEMNPGQAIGILIQAAKVAQSKGAFSLEDAAIVAQAVTFFEKLNKAN